MRLLGHKQGLTCRGVVGVVCGVGVARLRPGEEQQHVYSTGLQLEQKLNGSPVIVFLTCKRSAFLIIKI